MDQEPIDISEETGRWHTRPVTYWAGLWRSLRSIVPTFSIEEFKAADDAPANPFLRMVVRAPRTRLEQPVPVGVVSNTYALVQHAQVVDRCLTALAEAGVPADNLRCELGLTELGEWMNFRVFLPERFGLPVGPDDTLAMRLEVFNSVDGGSRLVVLFGWFRFVCGNGLVVGESVSEVRSIHNDGLDLNAVGESVRFGLRKATDDLKRLAQWQATRISREALPAWVDGPLAKAWGPKAACRTFSICTSGWDVEVADVSSRSPASQKNVKRQVRVPGSPDVASTLFDVSQALAWVAKDRSVPEERLERLRQIPELLQYEPGDRGQGGSLFSQS